MKIFTPKLIKKIFATMVVSGLVAGMTITVYATGGVTLSSRGNISYNADGEGDPDVYFSSSDLENLNTSLSTVNSSVSALSSRVGAAEADVTTIKNALGGSSGTELTTVMQNLLTGLNAKTGQNASTLQAAVNGMESLGSDVTYPEILPSGRSATDTGIRLNGYYNNKNLNVLMGGSYGINATTAASNEVEGKHTTSTSPYTQTTTDENASVLSITPQAGYYNGSTPIYVDLTNINNKYYENGENAASKILLFSEIITKSGYRSSTDGRDYGFYPVPIRRIYGEEDRSGTWILKQFQINPTCAQFDNYSNAWLYSFSDPDMSLNYDNIKNHGTKLSDATGTGYGEFNVIYQSHPELETQDYVYLLYDKYDTSESGSGAYLSFQISYVGSDTE